MKNIYFLLLSFLVLSCTKTSDCIVISRKESINNTFLFFWDDTSQQNTGLDASPIPSGAVSEEIYNQYEVGDTYCIEELML